MGAAGPSYESIADLARQADAWLLALTILLARPLAVVSVTPVFTRLELTPFLRNAVVMALTLPMLPQVAHALMAEETGTFVNLVLILKETLVGTCLGLALSLPFWAMTVAGDLVDLQRGATQSQLANPDGTEEVAVTGTLLVLSAVMVFVASGGLEMMAGAIYDSWAVWQPLAMLPMPDHQMPALMLALLDAIFRRGFELALPVMIAMLLADAAMIIVIRMAPQIHLDDVTLAARNLAFLIFMPLYAGYVLHYTARDQLSMGGVMKLLEPAFIPDKGGAEPAKAGSAR